MSPQEKKRARSSSPEDVKGKVKRSKTEVHSPERVQEDSNQVVMPAAAAGVNGDTREEPEHALDLPKFDDDGLLIIRPPPPITEADRRFGVKEPSPPPELTEEEQEIEELWADMEYALRDNGFSSPEKATSDSSYHSGQETDEESET